MTVHWLYSLTPWSHLKFRRQWGFYFRCWAASYLHFYRLSSYQIGPVTKDNKFLLRTNPPFHRSKVGLLNWAQLRRSIRSIVLIFTSITDDERSSEEIRHPPVILTGRWNIFHSKKWAGIPVENMMNVRTIFDFQYFGNPVFNLDYMEVGMQQAKLTNVELWPH